MKFMGFEFFKRRRVAESSDDRVERIRKEQEAAIRELDDSEGERLSEEYFQTTTHAAGLVMEGGEKGPYADEYRAAVRKVEEMTNEYGDKLFLYTTRKMALFRSRDLPFYHDNHWRYSFVRPQYIERLGNQLGIPEIQLLYAVITSRLKEHLTKIARDKEMIARHPKMQPNWEMKYWVEEVELHRKNLAALLPFLSDKEQKVAEQLLQESTSIVSE